jgi:hypothetical protein
MATSIQISYGRSILSWQDLGDILGSQHSASVSDQLAWLRHSAGPGVDARDKNSAIDIAELYTRTHTSQCQDKRDHVFGVQGLLPIDQRVVIDYGKTVEEVYADSFTMVLQHGSPGWVRAGALTKLGMAMGVIMPGSSELLGVRSEVGRFYEGLGSGLKIQKDIYRRIRLTPINLRQIRKRILKLANLSNQEPEELAESRPGIWQWFQRQQATDD